MRHVATRLAVGVAICVAVRMTVDHGHCTSAVVSLVVGSAVAYVLCCTALFCHLHFCLVALMVLCTDNGEEVDEKA